MTVNYSLLASGQYIIVELDSPLTTNRQYTITLLAGISGVYDSENVQMTEDYSFWFTSKYCPLFTSVGRVKLEAGPDAESLEDDTIYRMIHKNSMDAVDMFNLVNGTSYAYDYWGCTWHDALQVLRRYVECKTAYDILNFVEMAGNGDELKTLGDMTIKYGPGSGSKNNPDKKKQLYDCWNQAFAAIRGIKTAVRGYYDTSKLYTHPIANYTNNRVVKFEGVISDFNRTPGTYYRRTV